MMNKIKNGIIYGILLGLVVIIFIKLPIIPYAYDFLFGEQVIESVKEDVIENRTDPDEMAIAIMNWEKEYFFSPYPETSVNSTLQKFNIFEVEDEYRLFIRGAPASWIINTRMANCGEYSRVMIELLNSSGVRTRMVRVPGEDHAWVEYMSNGYWIVANPPSGIVESKRKFAQNRNWSYVEATNIFTEEKEDVSDEYIDRGKLVVRVTERDRPVEHAKVTVYSNYLMENHPDKYDEAKEVVSNYTNSNGIYVFELGKKNYTIKIEKRYPLNIYIGQEEKITTVRPFKTSQIEFEISGYGKNEIAYFIMLLSIVFLSVVLGYKIGNKIK